MSVGRTKHKWERVYVDGYDLSGYGRTIGPLSWAYDEADLTAHMSDTVKGYLPNNANVNLGTFNAQLAFKRVEASDAVLVNKVVNAHTGRGFGCRNLGFDLRESLHGLAHIRFLR